MLTILGLSNPFSSHVTAQQPAQGLVLKFVVDLFWPKPLPNRWILGQVAGVAVDAQDHLWIKTDGAFVKEFALAPDTRGGGSVWDLDFSPDPAQTYLSTADAENHHVWLLLRDNGKVLAHFARSGRYAGQLHFVHNMAVDSRGNVYTAEADNTKRVRKFAFPGLFPVGN